MAYDTMMTRPNVNRKRSVVVSKKRTSVSLEDSFWVSLQAIAKIENTTIEHYIEKIERKRDTSNLSSNLRIAVLEYYQQIAERCMTPRSVASASSTAHQTQGRLAEKVAAYWNKIDAKDPQPIE